MLKMKNGVYVRMTEQEQETLTAEQQEYIEVQDSVLTLAEDLSKATTIAQIRAAAKKLLDALDNGDVGE